MTSEVIELSRSDCELLLASLDIGRVAVVEDEVPLIFPINYKLATFGGKLVIAIRTRPGNVIDHPGKPVCFEIDSVDTGRDGGWSVLVRGVLVESAPDADHDSHPVDSKDRDAWRIIIPTHITGRRVLNPSALWSFHAAGYL
jgi:nitroimidazol reductase NimA-like FMN-containing flavoprotein (pyridoxamine 5'-phosphate oxidase superfamily)